MLDEATYATLTAAAFKRILEAADALDPDVLEADGTGDMVTLTSARGEKVVVNTQRAVQQIWVAGNSQGVHFSYDEQRRQWRDDKGKGLELFAWVADCVQACSGARLAL